MCELDIYLYGWKVSGELDSDNKDAGPMATDLWKLGEKYDWPLVKFADSKKYKINSEDDMKRENRVGKDGKIIEGKRLIVNLNALQEIL